VCVKWMRMKNVKATAKMASCPMTIIHAQEET
jgi:hypothetical protein